MTAMTAAERAKRYRDGKRDENVTKQERDAPDVSSRNRHEAELHKAVQDILALPEPPVDPLTLYSPDRWARMQAKGYVMPDDSEYDGQLNRDGQIPQAVGLGYARRKVGPSEYVFLVPVPGDPAYQGVAGTRPGLRTPCEDEVPDVVGMSRYD